MQRRSRIGFVLLLLGLMGCSAYNPSLLNQTLDSDVVDSSFDAEVTSRESSVDSPMDSSTDRGTGIGDVYAPIDDAGGDSEPFDSSADASRSDVTAPDLDASIDAETEDAETDAEIKLDSEVDPEDAEVSDDAQQDTGLPPCEGVRLFDRCWYLTDTDQSCEQFCADHQGIDPSTADYVGSTAQGGSEDNCRDILDALGFSQNVASGSRMDMGLGCHLWDDDAWWLSSPDFEADVSYPPVRIACACVE